MKYIVLHFSLLLFVFFGMRFYQGLDIIPDEKTLEMAFDVQHYNKIRTEGYSFNPDYGSNVAFFPGFPYLWKFLKVNVYGICIINILLFYAGIIIWKRYFSPTTMHVLLVLSVPSMFFNYMPYSEALFFFTGMILLAGLHHQNTLQSSSGLFLSSISRSAANIFLPAMILAYFINYNKISIKKLLLYCIIILSSIGIVAYIQFLQTGFAWGFIQTQKHWQHELQWPKLPFTSWGQYVWLDAVSLFFGLLCIFYCLRLVWFRIKNKQIINLSAAKIFAVFCLAGLTALPIIMNGGSYFSLNRYLLASPFFAIVIIHFLNIWEFDFKRVVIIFGLIFLTFASFHFFNHFRPILEYTIIAGYLTAILFLKHENSWLRRLAFIGLYAGNLVMQAHLADRFLRGEWIG